MVGQRRHAGRADEHAGLRIAVPHRAGEGGQSAVLAGDFCDGLSLASTTTRRSRPPSWIGRARSRSRPSCPDHPRPVCRPWPRPHRRTARMPLRALAGPAPRRRGPSRSRVRRPPRSPRACPSPGAARRRPPRPGSCASRVRGPRRRRRVSGGRRPRGRAPRRSLARRRRPPSRRLRARGYGGSPYPPPRTARPCGRPARTASRWGCASKPRAATLARRGGRTGSATGAVYRRTLMTTGTDLVVVPGGRSTPTNARPPASRSPISGYASRRARTARRRSTSPRSGS